MTYGSSTYANNTYGSEDTGDIIIIQETVVPNVKSKIISVSNNKIRETILRSKKATTTVNIKSAQTTVEVKQSNDNNSDRLTLNFLQE